MAFRCHWQRIVAGLKRFGKGKGSGVAFAVLLIGYGFYRGFSSNWADAVWWVILGWILGSAARQAAIGPRGGHPAATLADLAPQRRSANRKMAFGLACFVLTVLAVTFGTILIYRYSAVISGTATF